MDGVERQVPRHGPRLLARRAGRASASSPRASPAAPTCTRTTAAGPIASINFVTAHDGFTLHDLVSYNDKHNEANGEDNRDGESHNRSWNCGVEGPTEDGEIVALRERQKRNFLATLLLSQGVPMISHGDELGRTQQGNNNVYCQDNEISWIDWKAAREYSCSPSSPARSRSCAPSTRSSAAAGSSRAARSGQQIATSSGCAPTASR